MLAASGGPREIDASVPRRKAHPHVRLRPRHSRCPPHESGHQTRPAGGSGGSGRTHPTGTMQVIAGLYLVAITLRWLKYVLDVKYVLDGATYSTDAPENPPALPAGTEAGS